MLNVAFCLLFSAATVEGDKFEIDASVANEPIRSGASESLKLVIKAKEGYKVSKEAPLSIKLSAKGLRLEKSKLSAKDKIEKESEKPAFSVKFKAESKGKQSINVEANFFVCDPTICERKSASVSVPVEVL